MQTTHSTAYRATVECDAVHRHSVERRRIALGVDVFAQHRARALCERQRLDGQALEVLPDQFFSLGRGQH